MYITHSQKIILLELRKNSRKKLSKISNDYDIPLTTLHDAFCRMKKKQILIRCFSILNYSHLCFFQRSWVLMEFDEKKFIYLSNDAINNVAVGVMNGKKYFLLDLIFKNRNEFECYIEMLRKENKCSVWLYEVWGVEFEESFYF